MSAEKEPLVLAVDLGGTNCRLALVTHTGVLRARRSWPTPRSHSALEFVDQLAAFLREVAAGHEAEIQAVSLGIPAHLEPQQGLIFRAPNIPVLSGFPLGTELRRRLPWPVLLENDANLFALGEFFCGAGQGQDNFLAITLGTGVGGGLILRGRLWQGPLGTAAEFGHLIIDPEGRRCACGNRGCLETLASATGAMAWVSEQLQAGAASRLRDAWEDNPAALTGAALAEAAAAGDTLAQKAFNRVGRALAIAIVDVVHLLGLPLVLIGGKFARAWPLFYPALAEELRWRLTFFAPETLVIRPATLEDDAGLLGAAKLAWDRLPG